jgi:radical SAM superfamily enzyme YgiQ (UPF0313 family)
VSEVRHKALRDRLSAEVGRIEKDAPWRVALTSPSPYSVAMSSLGLQCIYGILQSLPGVSCERVFLSDGAAEPPLSYERLRPLAEFPLVALSVAYELELAGLVRLLRAAGLPLWPSDRDDRHPLLLAGGPLTFGNVLPLGAFADAVVLGEGEGVLEPVVETLRSCAGRGEALVELARLPHVWVPGLGGTLPPLARADDARLPARSVIRTPHAELSDMFLVEAERGCSRSCRYCVMRRERSGGMRIVPREVILAAVPADARRVGLVGAAVSDHPELSRILEDLAARGCEVGVSSLRPDRLSSEIVSALARAGGRTLTTALDGASEELRETLGRPVRDQDLFEAARLARAHGFSRLKLYLMLGLPGETDRDVDGCVRLLRELSGSVSVALTVSPFCAKVGTPLAGAPFAGVALLEARLNRLRRGLQGRVDVRSTSPKWAWVEHVLSTGAEAEGRAVAEAVLAGGRFADYRAAFGRLGHVV